MTRRPSPARRRAGLAVRRTPIGQRAIGIGALAVLLGAGGVMAAGAAGQRLLFFVPAAARGYPAWMRGPLAQFGVRLDAREGALLLVAMFACYLVAVACAEDIRPRTAIIAIVALHAIFLLAPPLFSADVFGYIDYARLGVLHGLNPYQHGAAAAPHDPAAQFVRWHDVGSPYGPLFTLASYALVHLSVPVVLWVYKILAAVAGLGCVALVWRIAARTGQQPHRAALFVGLNPLFVVYAVGGAHNDLLVELLVLIAIASVLSARPATAGVQLGLATLLKVSAGLVLPFALVGARRRGRLVAGTLAGALTVAVAALAIGRSELLGFVPQVVQQQQLVAHFSVPNQLGILLGSGAITSTIRAVCGAAFAVTASWMLVRASRGADWIACAGWTALAALLSSAWLTPWYAVWLVPLAAIADTARLRFATLGLCAYLVATRAVPHLT